MRILKLNLLMFFIITVSTMNVAAKDKPKFYIAKADTKKEACKTAEWEARKSCIRKGSTGIPAGGAECVRCREANAYQWECSVKYVCE